MDDDLGAFLTAQHDDFEDVASGVRSGDQPSVGILAEVVNDERVRDGMEHVLLGDIVAVR
ncbi:MAG: hypothetical protein ACSLFP_05775 [Acidimicrobiales bacterium]